MFRNPVLALDASAHANGVVATGLMLGKAYQGTLYGLHVLDRVALEGSLFQDLGGSLGLEPFQNVSGQLEPLLEEKGRLILKAFEQRCEAAGVACHTQLSRATVAGEIAEYAADKSLVVIGRQGETAHLSEDDIGSVVEGVARRSSVPVWITDDDAPDRIGSIVAGYDGSPRSAHALELAVELAATMGAKLTVIAAAADAGTRSARLDDVRERYQQSKVDIACRPSGEDSVAAILNAVRDEKADLLAIGAFGHNRFVEWVLGSTTSVLLRRAPCGVLLGR